MSKITSKTKQKLTKKKAPREKTKIIKTIQSWFEKEEIETPHHLYSKETHSRENRPNG